MSARVLIIGMHYAPEPSGSAPYTSGLASGLAERGHQVRVIAGYPHYPQWKVYDGYRGVRHHEVVEGVRVTRVRHPVPARPTLLARTVMEVVFGVHALCARWHRPDVVILTSPSLLAAGILSVGSRLRRHRPAVGIWVQDLYSNGMRQTRSDGVGAGMLTSVESAILRSADRLAVIHDRFKQQATARLRVDGARVDVIRNWSHLSDDALPPSADVRARMGWGDEIVVLHAGNMGVKQGLSNVVEAAELARTRNLPVKFVLMGDGSERASLEAASGGAASFVDPVPGDEFAGVLAAADVLLVNEAPGVLDMSVPSKLTSYFASGRPVVAATASGSVTAGEIEAAGAGIRVDAGDPAALVEAARQLSEDRELGDALGAAGRRYRTAVLSVAGAIERFEGWIDALAGGRDESVLARRSAR